MCPLCITTAALTTAGATSGGAGVLTLVAKNWRTVRRWAKVQLAIARLATATGGATAAWIALRT